MEEWKKMTVYRMDDYSRHLLPFYLFTFSASCLPFNTKQLFYFRFSQEYYLDDDEEEADNDDELCRRRLFTARESCLSGES